MRWRIDLSYDGSLFSGWQKQPGDKTVQQTIEEAFSMIHREPIEIVGCGRTDTGVHARKYTAHMDMGAIEDCAKFLYHVNAVLPRDIAIHSISQADADFHARFDAITRQYKYYLHFSKSPFSFKHSMQFNSPAALDQNSMQDAARLFLHYKDFLPFCKTGSDAQHYKCLVTESQWKFTETTASYAITANRFLRGMVRLIVGAHLNVGLGKLSLSSLEECLISQKPLPLQWSVPPEGLFLENVLYPGEE